MPPVTGLADMLATCPADTLIAALLGRDDLDDLARRLDLVCNWENFGDDHAGDLDRADRAALGRALAAAAEPNVERLAGLILAEVHAHMDAGRIPRTVASFEELHDHVDANMYLIVFAPFHVYGDCSCTPEAIPADEPGGEQPYVHADDCGIRARGGSEDRWIALHEAIATAVSARLAAEAAGAACPGDTAGLEIAGLQVGIIAAAERAGLPARFEVVALQAGPGQPDRAIRDTATGGQAPVPLFAYGVVRQVLAALFGGPDEVWVVVTYPDEEAAQSSRVSGVQARRTAADADDDQQVFRCPIGDPR